MALKQCPVTDLSVFRNLSFMILSRSVLLFTILAALVFTGIPPAAACTLSLTSSGFGTSDGSADTGPLQTASAQVQCTNTYILGMDGGMNLSGTRRLSDGAGNYIPYSLWQDAGANIQWGDNGMGTAVPYPADPLTATGTGSAVTHPVYATALTSGAFPPGMYTDLIQVTLIWEPYGPTDKAEKLLSLSLTLSGTCTLNTGGLNGFGNWPAGSADLQNTALGVVSVTCTPGVSFAVGMTAGQHWDGGLRNMSNGAETVPYILWTDSAGTVPWGDAGLSLIEPAYAETHPAPAQNSNGTGSSQNFFVWGNAMISGKPAGTYTDTVTITVVWP